MIEYIREQLSQEELLCQLAEEASELAHAALKLRRCIDGRNPTPVTETEAVKNLLEEVGDVLLCLKTLGFPTDFDDYSGDINSKLKRWVERLKEKFCE